MNQTAWLRCEVRPGMFANEAAICINTAEGEVLSFFLPLDFVKTFSNGSEEKAILVGVVDRTDDCCVVSLPRRSFEGSNAALVPAAALRFS